MTRINTLKIFPARILLQQSRQTQCLHGRIRTSTGEDKQIAHVSSPLGIIMDSLMDVPDPQMDDVHAVEPIFMRFFSECCDLKKVKREPWQPFAAFRT